MDRTGIFQFEVLKVGVLVNSPQLRRIELRRGDWIDHDSVLIFAAHQESISI
jgi:hypothetical protein